ncbi:cyclin-d-binding myb-like transcription factor 1 [Phtheirospermum japonicum]|uniref:Cyclin-d-binding myb-like transcription factor 1 n=1 Tax=Phtheirospermum japonicum TaxID=374723 RepID=A0A830AZA7_9LAMI|nr:cyclin-d-binding myb-like transcription factor 1 [Phtheirospermum japonicum]
MDEEEAVKNVTRKKEKKFKSKSNKGEKNEKSFMGIQEGHNINNVDAIEHVRVSGKDEIAEMKKDRKKDKAKKNKGGEVSESDIEKGTEEGESTVAYGEDGSGDAMDNVERKKKKREKNNTSSAKEVERNSTEDANKERKKQKVKRKREDGDFKQVGEKEGKEVGQHSQNCEAHDTEMVERKKRKKEKKKNKHDNSEAKHDESDSFLLQQENVPDNVEGNIESTKHDENGTKELERKKKKNKKNKNKDDVDNDSSGLMDTDEMECDEVEHAKIKKKKKKHTQLMENGSNDLPDNEVISEKKGKRKKTKSVENDSNDATPNKSNKKVRFSDQDEVFPIPGNSNTEKVNAGEENLVRGKRFTPEEDEIVKDAVLDYIERHVLGDGGLDMVLNCKKHPKLRGCWKEIASAIPYRPHSAVYYRAQILFRRSEDRKWTQEEYDEIINYQQEHGNEWKALAEGLGKHRFHVKDTWRRIKLSGRKTGHWSQEEYQKLFDLVNIDLQAKLSEPKISKHGMLRDNVCWTAISDELATRPQATCCIKWYNQLTSRMVAEGEWADTDDYRLIGALYSLDATCMEDVDWDGLVEGRTGSVCRKRWNQMVLHIGKHGHKSFAEQVEVLAQRYCPNLLEAREAWDSKPRVP